MRIPPVVTVRIVPRPRRTQPKRWAVCGFVGTTWTEREFATLLEAKNFCRERDFVFHCNENQDTPTKTRHTTSTRRGS